MRVRTAAFAAVAVAALAVSVPASVDPPRAEPAAEERPAMTLAVGGTAFAAGPGPALCALAVRCWDYALDVHAGGERLRLGVDHVVAGDLFVVEVTPPAGGAASFGPSPTTYSAERLFDDPAPGRWRLRVTAAPDVTDERFRLRARLDGPAEPPAHVPVPPNLQVLPPYDFSFLRPLSNGSTGNRPRGVPSAGGDASCHGEEVAAEHPVRCLRMAFGIRNTGEGPLALRYADGHPTGDRALYQRIEYADGGHEERRAGIARYHASHGHYHHHDAVELRLWRVTDPARGTLEPVGAARRKGFAHSNELLREWTRFYPVSSYDGFGLRPGWGDYYEWDRPGNFLDLGTHGDGEYVVRMTVDPGDGIAESDERDNTGYTHFRVTGDTVHAIESGHGSDPWDGCKAVLPIGAEFELAAPPPSQPGGCA